MTMPVEIQPVTTRGELERFIRLPMRLNAGDPSWIAPLMFERREALSPKHNPFFQHADVQFWLARKDGRDVGRISAQIDHLATTDPAAPAGYFGMIAAEDDPAVFAALFEVAEAWLKARGRAEALGPFNLSINEEVGLLIDGFETPPMFMMGHDPAYTAGHIEALGYAKAKDVFAYISDVPVFTAGVQARLKRPLPP
ncbi:MAG: dATP pyrophosphohydrolase, partial [Caulobacteraceae bacterium]